MTSYDRHASHNSPYRTGQHQPLPQSRHAPLTSIATDASESHTDLTTNLAEESDLNLKTANVQIQSAYQPGMRSSMQRTRSDDGSAPPRGEIQMQNFSEGLPPPPPVGHSWKRIDRWAEDKYLELWDNLGEPCTQNDINELEHELDCTLPMEVRESLQVHDGQERGGLPTGIIFGCMLLDCEEIVQEWKNWRKVNEDFLNRPSYVPTPVAPTKAFGGSSSILPSSAAQSTTKPTAVASSSSSETAPSHTNSMWREELLARQDSQPPNAIQKTYANSSWIPLARDWGGNCLAVDLAPGPAGKWGQVIIMGRDYDCKYVVARSWAAFLANVADDMSSQKVFVDENTNELKLREFRQPGVEPAYLNILRWRVDQKYGRKGPRRRSAPNGNNGDPKLTPNGLLSTQARGSPYSNPSDADRGRPQQRYSTNHASSSTMSPRATISSPLARVAEEIPAAVQIHSDTPSTRSNSFVTDKLMVDDELVPILDVSTTTPNVTALDSTDDKENIKTSTASAGLGVKETLDHDTSEMKAVDL